MKLTSRILTLVSAAVLLSACVSAKVGTIDAINGASAKGSPFTQKLTSEYRAMVNRLEDAKLYQTSSNALRFSRKGLASAQGTAVLPETLADWDLAQKDMEEMAPLRMDLIDALDNGGREVIPDTAAVAQSRFDCWVMEQEIDRGVSEVNLSNKGKCKSDFISALAAVKAALPQHPVAAAPEAPVADATPVAQVNFLVFFDWNKASLTPSAEDIMASVDKSIAGRKDFKTIVITGYTDTSGTNRYNDNLSLKRAKTVAAYLTSHGVPEAQIRVSARGENDLLVQTADNVRQPENRRVSITFE